MENECEALPGVAYPGVRDNCSTINTKTGYDDDEYHWRVHLCAVPICFVIRCNSSKCIRDSAVKLFHCHSAIPLRPESPVSSANTVVSLLLTNFQLTDRHVQTVKCGLENVRRHLLCNSCALVVTLLLLLYMHL